MTTPTLELRGALRLASQPPRLLQAAHHAALASRTLTMAAMVLLASCGRDAPTASVAASAPTASSAPSASSPPTAAASPGGASSDPSPGITANTGPVGAGSASASSAAAMPASQGVTDFLKDASIIAQQGLAAGKLAAQRGVDPAVRSLGQALASRHEAALRDIQAMARERAVPMPPLAPVGASEVLARLDTRAEGFDTTFIRTFGVETQQRAVARYEQASATLGDAALAQWTTRQTMELKTLLGEAQRIPLRGARDATPNSSNAGAPTQGALPGNSAGNANTTSGLPSTGASSR